MMKRAVAVAWLTAAAVLALAGTPHTAAQGRHRPASNVARFDWFSYEGRDPVYQKITAGPDQYLNPILPGYYPDPSICRVGADFYLVNSSFSHFPGIPVFHSTDLVHWAQIGHVLTRPSQLKLDGLGISRGVFAPMIAHHDGTFYLVNTVVDAGGNMVVTASNPAGPWSDPVWLGFNGIDPSLFFDDDGRAYIVNNDAPEGKPLYEGHRALWVQEFDARAKKMVGPRRMIVNGGVDIAKKPIWIEGPHILKVNGTYYLIAAEGGTAENHSEVVFRSTSVWGPWEPYSNNPILTQRHLDPARPFPVTSTGHASFVQTPKGDWWAVFLGTRPYKDDFYNTGRETFMLPVEWRDGWPHILDGQATVPYVVRRPDLPSETRTGTNSRRWLSPFSMKQGNFVERDEFSEHTLPPYWTFIRTVRESWYDLSSRPGWLTIKARRDGIGQLGQPSFVGRRQQHAYATVTAAMQYQPAKPGDKAGLVAFQNDDFYYLLAVTLTDGRPVVQLEKSGGATSKGTAQVLASAPLAPSESTLYLKIDANGPTYDFAYALAPDKWQTLKSGVDATFLSTKAAGGFVGAMLGMYAYSAADAVAIPSADREAGGSYGRVAQAQAHPLPLVTIPGSQRRSMHSRQTGRDYDIYVKLPDTYNKDAAAKYPVLYVLDGQWDFKLMDSVVGGLVYDKFMPPSIIVGITYSGAAADYDGLRAMDYTPANVPQLRGSGDASKFLAFLKSDLIPSVEKWYRIDSSRRVLMGSSYAGLFTLYALFTDPHLFYAYVPGSPAVTFGDRFAFKQEAEYAMQHRDLPARVFIGVGGIEGLAPPVQEIAKTIAGRNYAGLQLEMRVIEGERHAGNKPELFNRGLRWVFQ